VDILRKDYNELEQLESNLSLTPPAVSSPEGQGQRQEQL
jgi:hypothetical protein